MSDYTIPSNESERIKLVQEVLPILQSQPDLLQQLTLIATHFMNCTMGGITLVESESVPLIAKVAIESKDFSRSEAIDSYTILSTTEPLVLIPDLSQDYRFSSSYLVNGPLSMYFYAAVPIIYQEVKIGSLFVADNQPHAKSEYDSERQSIFQSLGDLLSQAISNTASAPSSSSLLFSEELQFTEEFAHHMLECLLKQLKGHYQTYVTNQDEFQTTIKLLSKNSKNQTEEVKQTLLQSVDSLQTVILDASQASYEILKNGLVIVNALKPLLQKANNTRAFSGQPSAYLTINDWVRSMKKFVAISRHQEGNIKWDYEHNMGESNRCYDHCQELLGYLITVYMIMYLPKWKNITVSVNFQVDGEKDQQPVRRKSDDMSSSIPSDATTTTTAAQINMKSGKVVIEIACFHRNSGSSGSSPKGGSESLPFLLDEMTLKVMELLQGSFEKSQSPTCETFKLTMGTCLFSKQQKNRRSLTFRNSIIAIEETIRSSILMVAYRENKPVSEGLVVKTSRSTTSKKSGRTPNAPSTKESSRTTKTEVSESVTAKSSHAGSFRENLTIPTLEKTRTEGITASDNNNSELLIKPKSGRRRSSISKANKIKANIISSFVDSIMAVAGQGPSVNVTKKSLVVPTAQ